MPEEIMIIIIVAIVATVLIIKAGLRHVRPLDLPHIGGNHLENERLREDVKALKERVHVLERITTDKENSLAREIDDLRDR